MLDEDVELHPNILRAWRNFLHEYVILRWVFRGLKNGRGGSLIIILCLNRLKTEWCKSQFSHPQMSGTSLASCRCCVVLFLIKPEENEDAVNKTCTKLGSDLDKTPPLTTCFKRAATDLDWLRLFIKLFPPRWTSSHSIWSVLLLSQN